MWPSSLQFNPLAVGRHHQCMPSSSCCQELVQMLAGLFGVACQGSWPAACSIAAETRPAKNVIGSCHSRADVKCGWALWWRTRLQPSGHLQKCYDIKQCALHAHCIWLHSLACVPVSVYARVCMRACARAIPGKRAKVPVDGAYRSNGRWLLEDGCSHKLPKVQDCSHGDAEDAEGCNSRHRPAMQGCLIISPIRLAAQCVQCTAHAQQEIEQKVEDLHACCISSALHERGAL